MLPLLLQFDLSTAALGLPGGGFFLSLLSLQFTLPTQRRFWWSGVSIYVATPPLPRADSFYIAGPGFGDLGQPRPL